VHGSDVVEMGVVPVTMSTLDPKGRLAYVDVPLAVFRYTRTSHSHPPETNRVNAVS